MVRGGDFYAVWDEDKKLWSTNEDTVIDKVDALLLKRKEELQKTNPDDTIIIKNMWDSNSGSIDIWHKYVQKQMRESFHQLDSTVTFSDMETTREMYASKKLKYALSEGPCPSYDEIMSTLYEPSEREKLEWAIGAILSGDSQTIIQKFIVLYGPQGSGKGTFLKILEGLFEGYNNTFRCKELTSARNDFALEDFKSNPLVSIDPDAKLDKIEDNTLLNSIVSHETMSINEKYAKKYPGKFNTFIFIGSNDAVKITNAKSGLIRRLIDVNPSKRKIPHAHYDKLMKQVKFEYGQIAKRCLDIYNERGPYYYDKYVANSMIQITNEFYNFMEEMYDSYREWDQVTLAQAWEAYNQYNIESNNKFPYTKRVFKSELKDYFQTYEARSVDSKGNPVRDLYTGFLWQKFDYEKAPEDIPARQVEESWLKLTETVSILDEYLKDKPAQYAVAGENGQLRAERKWINNRKTLKDIDTRRVHYVILEDSHHIIIDFDGPDLETNLKEASLWPPTYAEFSRSGYKIHLHYIYDGDPSELSPIYKENIEQKVYLEHQSTPLRRRLTYCNALDIAHISSGLKKRERKEIMFTGEYKLKDENHIRNCIKKALRKEINLTEDEIASGKKAHTTPCINYICEVLENAYTTPDISYNVNDLKDAVMEFALNSTNQASANISKVLRLHFCSKDYEKVQRNILNRIEPIVDNSKDAYDTEAPIAFYDVEVFKNLFIVCYKQLGPQYSVNKLINPSPEIIAELFASNRYRWIGFNSQNYDVFIIHKRYCGGTNLELYELSRSIINNDNSKKNYKARTIDYADIFDISSKKQSLKRFEVELSAEGKCVSHQELGLPWDEEVDESLWLKVADYCANDVLATEAVFLDRQGDFKARQILVDIVNAFRGPGSHVRDSNNSLTTRLLVGDKVNPQAEYIYPDLSKRFPGYRHSLSEIPIEEYKGPEYTVNRHAIYKGVDPGYGGHVFAIPGIYPNVVGYDVDSMHPWSIIDEMGFGPEITPIFKELVELRYAIKSKNYDKARTMFGGVVAKYLDNEDDAAALGQALKIVINSVYGLTSAKFENKLRDPRNVDNWVAKRGALFMIDLHEALDNMGVKVVHIKTDSIKVVNPTKEVEDFIFNFAHEYGYNFKVEDRFDRFCLINESTYVALDTEGNWHTVGKEFQVPYVKKKLFTHENIEFEDLCEFKSAQTSIYLDLNEAQPYLAKLFNDESISTPSIIQEIDKNGNIIYHDYHFIGKTGRFVPVLPGHGGGALLRKNEDLNKFDFVTGTKKKSYEKGVEEPFYRWLEAETIEVNDAFDIVDYSYWDTLVLNAKKKLEEFGSYEYFVSTELGHFMDFLDA